MKKIINGRKYDTDTAKYIDSMSYGYNSDFDHYFEELYRKRTGEFFLYGEGNGLSPYAKSEGQNCWGPGCGIIPLTEDRAKEWVEENCSTDTYEELFGEISE